jgi:hypothetical protein
LKKKHFTKRVFFVIQEFFNNIIAMMLFVLVLVSQVLNWAAQAVCFPQAEEAKSCKTHLFLA